MLNYCLSVSGEKYVCLNIESVNMKDIKKGKRRVCRYGLF